MIFKFEGEILQVFFLFFCCYISIVSNMYLQHRPPPHPPTHTNKKRGKIVAIINICYFYFIDTFPNIFKCSDAKKKNLVFTGFRCSQTAQKWGFHLYFLNDINEY